MDNWEFTKSEVQQRENGVVRYVERFRSKAFYSVPGGSVVVTFCQSPHVNPFSLFSGVTECAEAGKGIDRCVRVRIDGKAPFREGLLDQEVVVSLLLIFQVGI